MDLHQRIGLSIYIAGLVLLSNYVAASAPKPEEGFSPSLAVWFIAVMAGGLTYFLLAD